MSNLEVYVKSPGPQKFDYMLDPPEYFCEDCGEDYEVCVCSEYEDYDYEPDDFEADMAADMYFGDY